MTIVILRETFSVSLNINILSKFGIIKTKSESSIKRYPRFINLQVLQLIDPLKYSEENKLVVPIFSIRVISFVFC